MGSPAPPKSMNFQTNFRGGGGHPLIKLMYYTLHCWQIYSPYVLDGEDEDDEKEYLRMKSWRQGGGKWGDLVMMRSRGWWVHRGKDHRVTIELADERLNAPWLGMLAPNARHWGNDDSRPGDDDDSHGDGHWYLFGSHIVGFLVSATGYRLSHFIYYIFVFVSHSKVCVEFGILPLSTERG